MEIFRFKVIQPLILLLSMLYMAPSCQANSYSAQTLLEAQEKRQELINLLALDSVRNAVMTKSNKTEDVNDSVFTLRKSENAKIQAKLTPIDTAFKNQLNNHVYVEDIEDMNFDYITCNTPSEMQPIHIFDDGRFTYISLKPKLMKKDLRVTVQHPDDRLQLADYKLVDRFIRLDGLYKAVRITTDTRKCEIINKAFFADS